MRVATLKLVNRARSFYDATPELHRKNISWTDFKNVFLERFKDSRNAIFYSLNYTVPNRDKKETVTDFADRVRKLARQVTPQTDDPEAQMLVNLQTTRMMIVSFTNGLRGNPGIQTRFASPSVMEDAVRIAVTIEQAESCKGKSETFYVDSNTVATERSKPSRSSAKGRNPNTRTENSLSRSDFRCYECEGKGHYASICPTRKLRLESEKKGKRISDKVPETPNKKQPSRGKWRGNRQLRKPSENS